MSSSNCSSMRLGLLARDPRCRRSGHLAAVVADSLLWGHLEDDPARRVEKAKEPVLPVRVVWVKGGGELGVEPRLRVGIVEHRAQALPCDRLITPYGRSRRADDDAYARISAHGGDARPLAGCRQPEAAVPPHVRHRHTDRPALLVRPDEGAFVVG